LAEQPLLNDPDVHWKFDDSGHRLTDSHTDCGHWPAQENRGLHSLTLQHEKHTFVLFHAS
jgi:hypothetical protein